MSGRHPNGTYRGGNGAADAVLDQRCKACGVFSTNLEYGLCSQCIYVPRSGAHPDAPRPFRIVHDPQGLFRTNGRFQKEDFEATLRMGCWPDGLVVEYRGRIGKVTVGDDGRGRMTWYRDEP